MKIQRKWKRLWEKESELCSLDTAKSSYGNLKRSLAALAAFSIIMQPISALASVIEGGGAFNPTIKQNGDVYDITPNNFIDGHAFNSFNKFQLSQNHIANFNMYHNVNLFNFVNSRIDISGTVNTLRNGKIGGNLYFLSREGMIINSSGVINTGSMHILTPNQATMNRVFGGASASYELITSLTSDILSNNIPLTPEGTIIVKGKINVTNNIRLMGQHIQLDGAKLNTGITDFSNLVNVSQLPSGTQIDRLMMSPSGGNIILIARANKNLSELSELPGKTIESSVEIINGTTLDAVKNIEINAKSERTSGELNPVKASVLIDQASSLQAQGDISITAQSAHKGATTGVVETISQGQTGIVDQLGLGIFDAGTAYSSSNAEVTVFGDITSDGKVALEATSESESKLTVSSGNGILVHKVDSAADITIGGKIVADEVVVGSTAKTTIKDSVTAESDDGTLVSLAVGITDGSARSSVKVLDQASILANQNVEISSKTESSISSETTASMNGGAMAAVAVNVVNYESDATIDLNGNIQSTAGNVTVEAENKVTNNSISAETTNESTGSTSEGTSQADAENMQGKLSGFGENSSTAEAQEIGQGDGQGGSAAMNAFTGAGALVVANESNKANITVGGNIESAGKTTLSATTFIEDTKMKVESGVTSDAMVTISGGVLVSNMTNEADVNIANGVKIKANGIQVDARVKMDVEQYKKLISRIDDVIGKLSGADKTKAIDLKEKFEKLNMEGIVNDSLLVEINDGLDYLVGLPAVMSEINSIRKDYSSLSSFANYSAQSNSKNESTNPSISGSGTVSVNTITNKGTVNIGNGVTLDGEAGDVVLNAETTTKVWNLAGMLGGNPLKGGVSSASGAAIGGTYTQQNLNSDATVTVGANAEISGGDIDLHAKNDVVNVSAALGSGKGKMGAITGMVSVANGDSHTTIAVNEGTKITAAGDVSATGENTTTVTNIAGGISQSSAAAVGIGVAINHYDVQNQVVIGERGKQAVIIKADNVNASAKTDGIINAISLAGGLAKDDSGSQATGEGSANSQGASGGILDKLKSAKAGAESIKDKADSIQNLLGGDLSVLTGLFDTDANGDSQVSGQMNKAPEEQRQTKDSSGNVTDTSKLSGNANEKQELPLSISGAGSLSLNLIDTNTKVEIVNSNIEMSQPGEVRAIATDQSWVGAWSGAAAISWSNNNNTAASAAFSGAVALNNVSNQTTSLIEDSSIKGAQTIDVLALGESNQIAAGLGVQVSKSPPSAASIAGGAAASVNLVDREINAKMKNVVVEGTDTNKTDVNVAVFQGDLQVAGGLNISAGNSNLGLGGTVVVSNVQNDLSAGIEGGKYTNVDDIKVDALLATTQIAAAASAGMTTNPDFGVSLNGAFVVNRLENDVNASIKGAEIIDAKEVNVTAQDTRKGSTLAGAYMSELNGTTSSTNANYASDRGISTTGEEYYDGLNTNITADPSVNSQTTDDPKAARGHADGAIIVTGAASGSLTTGTGAAAGAAVAVTDIHNKYSAQVDSSTIQAEQVNVAGSSNTLIVNAAGGAALATGGTGFAAMGSVAWQNLENSATAKVSDSTIKTDRLDVEAANKALMVNVAGQVSVGTSAAGGAALAVNNLDNNAIAKIVDSKIDEKTPNGSGINVAADNESLLVNVAISGAASNQVAVSGTASVNRVIGSTEASIDDSILKNVDLLKVSATDKSKIFGISGAFSASSTVAVGGALSYNEVGNIISLGGDWLKAQQVTAQISDTTIETKNDAEISVDATNEAQIFTAAAAAGGSGTVAVQGAGTMNVINKDTQALIQNSNINKEDKTKKASVDVTAKSKAEIDSLAVAIAGSGTVSGGAGIGGNVIVENNSAKVSGGEYNVKDLDIRSHTADRIVTIGTSAAGSGTVGLAGSVTVNTITNNVTASISDGAKVYADGSVGVSARTDNSILNYVGTIGVGIAGGGAGLSVSVNNIGGDTKAEITGSDTEVSAEGNGIGIDTYRLKDGVIERDFTKLGDYTDELETAIGTKGIRKDENYTIAKKQGVVVDALSTNEINSYMVTTSGGSYVGASGTSATNIITGNTTAQVDGAKLNTQNQVASGANLHSADYLKTTSMVGAIGISGGVSAGAGVDTNVTSRKAQAILNGAGASNVANIKNLNVEADARQGVLSFNAGIAGGLVAGAGTVSTVVLNSETEAKVTNLTTNITGNVNVASNHISDLHLLNASISVGGGAGGLAVGVINDNSKTLTTVENSQIDLLNQGDVTIKAQNKSEIESALGVVTVAGMGVSGAVTVSSLDSEVATKVRNSKIGENNKAGKIDISAKNIVDVKNNLGSFGVGGVHAGASIAVNNVNNRVNTNITGSTLASTGDVVVLAHEERNLTQNSASVAIAGTALNVNVVVNNIGGKLKDVTLEGKKATSDKKDEEADSTKNSSVYKQVELATKASGDGSLKSENTLGAVGSTQTSTINNSTKVNDGKGAADSNKKSSVGVNVTSTTIDAGNNINVKSQESGTTKINMATGTLGGNNATGSVAIMNVNRQLAVNLDNAKLIAGNKVEVTTDISGKNTIDVYQGSGGAISLGGAYAKLKVQGESAINIANNSLVKGKEVKLLAKDSSNATVNAFGLTVGGVAIGGIVANAENGSNSSISVKNSTIESTTESTVTIKAEKTNTVTAEVNGLSVGLISGSGLLANADNKGTASIDLDQTKVLNSQGNTTISALSQNTTTATVIGGSVGYWGSGAALVANATDNSNAEVTISGSSSEVNGKDITVESTLENTVTADATGGSAAAGVSMAGLSTSATNNGSAKITVSDADIIATGALNIKGLSKNTVTAKSTGGSVGLIGSGAAFKTTASDSSSAEVEISGSASEVRGNAVTVDSTLNNTVTSTALGGSVGGVSGVGFVTEATNSGNAKVRVSDADVTATGALIIKALSNNTINSTATGGSVGLIGSGTAFKTTASDSSSAEIEISGSTSEVRGNAVTVDSTLNNTVTSTATGGSIGGISGVGFLTTAQSLGTGKINLNGSKIISTKTTNINAYGKDIVTATSIGGSVGLGSSAQLKSDASASSKVFITIGEKTTIEGNGSEINQGVNINSTIENEVDSSTKLGSGGVASASGTSATGRDSSEAKIEIGDESEFKGNQISVTASNMPKIKSIVDALDISAVGKSLSKTEAYATSQAVVQIGSKNTFDGQNVEFKADIKKNGNTVEAIGSGFAVRIIGGSDKNIATAESNTIAKVDVGSNTYKDDTNLTVAAASDTKQKATMTKSGGGFVSLGSGYATTTSKNTTTASVSGATGDDWAVTKNLTLTSTGKTENEVESSSSTGGFADVRHDAAVATSVIETTTTATLQGNWNVAEKITAKAIDEKNKAGIKVSANSGGVGSDVGAKFYNTEKGNTVLNIQNGVLRSTKMEARAERTIDIDARLDTSGKGFVGLSASETANTIDSKAAINLANIKVYTEENQDYRAFTKAEVDANIYGYGAGFASSSGAYNNGILSFNNEINLTSGSLLANSKVSDSNNILLRTGSDITLNMEAKAENSFGAGGNGTAKAIASLNRIHQINIAGDIRGLGNVILREDTGSKESINLYAYSHNETVFASASAEAKLTGKTENLVNVTTDATILSAKNIDILLAPSSTSVSVKSREKTWYKDKKKGNGTISKNDDDGKYYDADGNLVDSDGNRINSDGSYIYGEKYAIDSGDKSDLDSRIKKRDVKIDGKLIAGSHSQFDIRLGGDGSILQEVKNDSLPKIEVRDFVTGEWKEWNLYELGAKISDDGTTIEFPDLKSEGGNITITSDTLTGNGQGTLEARGAKRINIENNTNLDLKLQSAEIGSAGGGTVKWNSTTGTVNGTLGSTVKVVSRASLGSDDRQGIYLTNNWNPYQHDTHGTDINVTGTLKNSIGLIQIINKDGNVKVAEIVAQKVDAKVWHGDYTQDAGTKAVNFGTGSEIVASGNVTIKGASIANNGKIQSGIAEYEITDDGSWAGKIAGMGNASGLTNEEVTKNDKYKLNSSGLVKQADGTYKYVAQAYYNPSTGEIFVEDMVAHGGQVLLTSTLNNSITGNGSIRALSGMADASIKVLADKELHLGRIEMTNITGKVSIKDGGINERIYVDDVDRATGQHYGSTNINFIGDKAATIKVNAKGDVVLESNVHAGSQTGGISTTTITSQTGSITQEGGVVKSDKLTLASVKGQTFEKDNKVHELVTQNTGTTGDIIFNNIDDRGLEVTFTNTEVKGGKVTITNESEDLKILSAIRARDNIALVNNGKNMVTNGALTSDEKAITITTKDGTIENKGKVTAELDISITSDSTTNGDITNRADVLSKSGAVKILTEKGNLITEGTVKGKNDVELGVNLEGDITTGKDITSTDGKVKIWTNKGAIWNKGKITAKDDVYIYSGIGDGDITNDKDIVSSDGNVQIITTPKGNVLNKGDITANTGITVTSGEGTITNKGNLTTSTGDINIETTIGAITNEKDLTASNGNISIKNTEGDVLNQGTLWAKDDVRIYAGNGHIDTKKAIGENIYAELATDWKDIHFGEIGIGHLISLIGNNEMTLDYAYQLPNHDNMVTIRLKSIGDRTPIRNVDFRYLDSPNGVVLDGLWANKAYVHVQAEKFYIPQVKISDYGYFSNKHAKAKIYGSNPWREDAMDYMVWNDATWYSPRIDFFFYGGRDTAGNGSLLWNREYYRHFNERYNQVNYSSMAQFYTDAGLAFLWEENKTGNSFQDGRLIDDLIKMSETLFEEMSKVEKEAPTSMLFQEN